MSLRAGQGSSWMQRLKASRPAVPLPALWSSIIHTHPLLQEARAEVGRHRPPSPAASIPVLQRSKRRPHRGDAAGGATQGGGPEIQTQTASFQSPGHAPLEPHRSGGRERCAQKRGPKMNHAAAPPTDNPPTHIPPTSLYIRAALFAPSGYHQLFSHPADKLAAWPLGPGFAGSELQVQHQRARPQPKGIWSCWLQPHQASPEGQPGQGCCWFLMPSHTLSPGPIPLKPTHGWYPEEFLQKLSIPKRANYVLATYANLPQHRRT